MKNIKGIPRKTKYEVLSVEVLGFSYEGLGRYMSADLRLRRSAGTADMDTFIRNMARVEDMSELKGMKPYLVSVRIPIRNHNRGKTYKPNDWKERTIATLAVDEIEAYNLAKREIQWRWQKAFKLNRYAKR